MATFPVILNDNPNDYVSYSPKQIWEYERRRYKLNHDGREPTDNELKKIIMTVEWEIANFCVGEFEHELQRDNPIMVAIVAENFDPAVKLRIEHIPIEWKNKFAIVQPNKDDFSEIVVYNEDGDYDRRL